MKSGRAIGSTILGGITGWNLYSGLDSLLETTNINAVVLQEYLVNNPLTKEGYQTAMNNAMNIMGDNYFLGLANLILAGGMAGLTIYIACNKREDEE